MSKKMRGKEETVLAEKLKVVNIGISTFADDLRSQNVEVVHVDWKPPAGGDQEMLRLLEKLGLQVNETRRSRLVSSWMKPRRRRSLSASDLG